jgi:hypothetical protein
MNEGKPVPHYELLVAETPGEMEKLCQDYLRRGFQFCGNMFVSVVGIDKTFYQGMVTDY